MSECTGKVITLTDISNVQSGKPYPKKERNSLTALVDKLKAIEGNSKLQHAIVLLMLHYIFRFHSGNFFR